MACLSVPPYSSYSKIRVMTLTRHCSYQKKKWATSVLTARLSANTYNKYWPIYTIHLTPSHLPKTTNGVPIVPTSEFVVEISQTEWRLSTNDSSLEWYANGRRIDAEFSLQRPSHNSRENNQRQSGSQIREIWARFVTYCYWESYAKFFSFRSHFCPFLATEALS